MRTSLLLMALVICTSYASSAQTFVDEPVTVRNYSRSPVQLRIVRTWVNSRKTDKWDETCVELDVLVRATDEMNTFSYQLGPRGKHPYVFIKSGLPPSGKTVIQCVPNDRTLDENEFVIRMNFVENSRETVWESKEHRREVRKLFKIQKISNPS